MVLLIVNSYSRFMPYIEVCNRCRIAKKKSFEMNEVVSLGKISYCCATGPWKDNYHWICKKNYWKLSMKALFHLSQNQLARLQRVLASFSLKINLKILAASLRLDSCDKWKRNFTETLGKAKSKLGLLALKMKSRCYIGIVNFSSTEWECISYCLNPCNYEPVNQAWENNWKEPFFEHDKTSWVHNISLIVIFHNFS